MDSQPIPFGLDPTTFATLVALGILLGTRVIEALIPKGSRFRFTQKWFVNGEKVKEEVTETNERKKRGDRDDSGT